jgi:lysophospholipase L1-like esterase
MISILSGGLCAATVALVEAGMRVLFAFEVGPSVLFYGTPWGQGVTRLDERLTHAPLVNKDSIYLNRIFKKTHADRIAWAADRDLGSYKKYQPNQTRIDRDQLTGVRFDVRINGLGFRGADFEPSKPKDVIRVVTLGASSTFGYFNRDDTTYPVLLEERLRAGCAGRARYEVLNLGIPHLDVAQIRSLFTAEGLGFEPDVVTLYSGRNDSLTAAEEDVAPSRSGGLVAALSKRLILAAFADSLFDLRGLRMAPDVLDARATALAQHFVENVEAIRVAAEQRDALFIAVSQQAASMTIERTARKGIAYAEERAAVRARLDGGQGLLRRQAVSFLAHAKMMDALRDYVKADEVPFVDGIAALDAERDVLLSWVHLSPHGNALLADALADEILSRTCPNEPVTR